MDGWETYLDIDGWVGSRGRWDRMSEESPTQSTPPPLNPTPPPRNAPGLDKPQSHPYPPNQQISRPYTCAHVPAPEKNPRQHTRAVAAQISKSSKENENENENEKTGRKDWRRIGWKEEREEIWGRKGVALGHLMELHSFARRCRDSLLVYTYMHSTSCLARCESSCDRPAFNTASLRPCYHDRFVHQQKEKERKDFFAGWTYATPLYPPFPIGIMFQ